MSAASGELNTLTAQLALKPTLVEPVKPGDVIGKTEVRQGDRVLKQADAVAPEPVEQDGFFSSVRNSIRLLFKELFG